MTTWVTVNRGRRRKFTPHFHFQRTISIMATTSKSKTKEDAPIVMGTIPTAILRLEKMLGGAAGSNMISFAPLKEKVLLSLQGNGSIAEAVLSKPIPGLDSSWDFPLASLSAALQKRDSAQIKFSGGQMDITDKRYSTSLQGTETAKPLRVEKPAEGSTVIEVTPELWTTLEEMTGKVRISKSLAAMPDITIHFLFTKKLGLAVAFDRFQMAAFAVPNTFKQEFALTLPLAKAESLFKNNIGITVLAASESSLYTKAGTLSYSSSLPSVEDTTGVPTEAVVERVKALRSAKFPRNVVLPLEELKRFLANAKAISNANALLKFEIGETSTKLTLSAEGNKVSATVPSKAKKAFSFKLDIGYVNTIVAKSGEDVHLEVDDSALVFRTDELIYASVLSVDEESEQTSKKRSKNNDSEDEE